MMIYKDDIMYRQIFRKERTEPIEQLMLPKLCRLKVLKVSHNIPLVGHLRRKKTLQKIKQRFYWPKMNKDVSKYRKTGHL